MSAPAAPTSVTATPNADTATIEVHVHMPSIPPGGALLRIQRFRAGAWEYVRDGAGYFTADPDVYLIDYEVASQYAYLYRAQAYNQDGTSGWVEADDYVDVDYTEWWLKDPLVPSSSMRINVSAENRPMKDFEEPQLIGYPRNSAVGVVISQTVHAAAPSLTLNLIGDTQLGFYAKLINSGRTLFLCTPYGTAYYVRPTSPRSIPEKMGGERFKHTTDISWTVVRKP